MFLSRVLSEMADGLEKARSLLLEAMESLTQAGPTAQTPANTASSESAAGPSGSNGSALRERNRLFNFGFRRKAAKCGSSRVPRAPKSKRK